MFPDRSNLAELASTPKVRLDEAPFPLLLVAHHAIESSGMLVAKRGPIEKRVLLDHGVPVDCRSNLVHETLSRYLVSVGRLSDAVANEALGRSLAQGRLLGEMLVAEGRLEAGDLQRLLQQSLARKLFDLFTWREGEIRFEAGSVPSAAAMKVKVPRLVLTGVERYVPQEVAERAVAPLVGTSLGLAASVAALREELRPTAREAALLDALAQPRRIDELGALLELPAEELVRLVWGFALLGLVVPVVGASTPVVPAATQPSPPPPARAAQAPAPLAAPARASASASTQEADTAPAPPPADELRKLRETVRRAYAGFRDKDAFDLLSAGEDATSEEIRQRYFAFARLFAPWRFEPAELRGLETEAKELFAAGAIAFARLADPRERESLRSERRRLRGEARREASASHFKIETDLLDADAQYQKGLAFKLAKKLAQALQQFEFAADCDAQNGTYRAEAAHTRFLMAPTSMGGRALDELKEAQRVDPESTSAWLYAGEIAAKLGRTAEAERSYRQAAKILGPDDRRALDALRELAKKKKR